MESREDKTADVLKNLINKRYIESKQRRVEAFIKFCNSEGFNKIYERNKNDEIMPGLTLKELREEDNWQSLLFEIFQINFNSLFWHKEIPINSNNQTELTFTQDASDFFMESLNTCQIELLEGLFKKNTKTKDRTKKSEITILPKIPFTRHPKTFITPKDKVSNLAFAGKLSEEMLSLKTEGRDSKKELTARVNINIEALKNISISRDLSPYDREVHDSIVSLYIDGGNEYITPLMIYRTMTGNPNAKLLPKQQVAISESVDRCSYTKIRIDATDEAKAYGMDKAIYEGNLLYTEKATVLHLGKKSEWIHLLRKPVLYDYASSKDQIGRLDIKLLDTPTNKNEEVIILQGYLQRRILSMKGSSLSRNIVYDTIYKYLNVSSDNPAVERNKKNKIRDFVREILKYWVEQRFISGFTENKKGNVVTSITIDPK